MLYGRNGQKDSLSFEGVRVVDPVQGIDATLTVTVEDGVVARIEPASGGNGKVLAPAFVDPHVHLRTPGREDEEDLSSGTRAAAAGGYCAILAMPNTEPVVDSAAVLGALIEQAQEQADVPVGFLAAITKGQEGAELTEMGELAERGAAGFSDDGRPVPGSCAARCSTGLRRGVRWQFTARSRRSRAGDTSTRARSPPSSASAAIRPWRRA
jgi:dihydroorotase